MKKALRSAKRGDKDLDKKDVKDVKDKDVLNVSTAGKKDRDTMNKTRGNKMKHLCSSTLHSK